jgi:hypothetical protein
VEGTNGTSESRKPAGEPREPPGEPPHLDKNANPVEAHNAYMRARLGGGAPATPEAYQRALEQWHALRGAVRAPAAELTGPDGLPPAGEVRCERPGDEHGAPRAVEIDDADNTS